MGRATTRKPGRTPDAPAPAGRRRAGAADATPEPGFEEAIERLEGLVGELEHGDLDLEASLAAFEEGVALARAAAARLDAAERRIEVLVKEGERWLARDFGPETGADADGDGDEDADMGGDGG